MEDRQGLGPRTKIVAGDRRLTMCLMGIWHGLRRDAEHCVAAADFFAAMPEDLWTDCFIVERTADGAWQICRVGETIARRSGVRAAPSLVADLPPQTLLSAAVAELNDAQRTAIPFLDDGETRDENGRRALFRSILLPLGDQEGQVVQFLAGARWRVDPEDARRRSP